MAPLKPTYTLAAGVLEVSSAQPVGGPLRFVVERDMDVPADGLQFWLATRGDLAPGDAVTLRLGYDGAEEQVFTGTLVCLRPFIGGVMALALGPLQALLDLRAPAFFENQTAGAITRELAEQAGVETGTVDEGPPLPRFAVDSRLSAYAHLRGLAERLGFEIYANRAGALMFHALGAATKLDAGGLAGAIGGAFASAASALLGGKSEGYRFGQHLLEAHADRRTAPLGTVEVGGESPMSGQGDTTAHWLTTNDSDYRGAAGDGAPRLLVLDAAARTKDLADRFAAGLLATANRRAHQISVRVLGRPGVDLGQQVDVGDVPDALLNGGGYLRAIRHGFDAREGFVSELRICNE